MPATESDDVADEVVERLHEVMTRLTLLQSEVTACARDRANLVAELQAYGWSLQRIADAVGVSKQAIAAVAKRVTPPPS